MIGIRHWQHICKIQGEKFERADRGKLLLPREEKAGKSIAVYRQLTDCRTNCETYYTEETKYTDSLI